MNRTKYLRQLALAIIATGVVTVSSFGADVTVDLKAEQRPLLMPDSTTTVQMWGFFNLSDVGTDWTPGPRIKLTNFAATDTLTINLTNSLAEPTSIVIPGQVVAMTPTWTDGTTGPRTSLTQRVRSFTSEAAPAGSQTYTFTGLRPGTYLYQTGTHPSVQVQMGLYGVITVEGVAGEAYPGLTFDNEAVLLYSEVDPALHAAVATGAYGTSPAPTSTFDYQPKYFLVNGKPYPDGAAVVDHPITAGERVLVRLLNSGLRSHDPVIQGGTWSVIAEDGNKYQWAHDQYSAFLPAGKTIDAIFTPAAAGSFPVFDAALDLTNSAATGGGLLAYLSVAAAPGGAPIAANASFVATEDTALTVSPKSGLLTADGPAVTAQAISGPTAGRLQLAADGSFTYTPQPDFAGTDTFAYRKKAGKLVSNVATVLIKVTPVNDAPLGRTETYTASASKTLTVAAPGVLGNDTDVDGPQPLRAVLVKPPAIGALTLKPDGSFSYVPPTKADQATAASFSYTVQDGARLVGKEVTSTITVNPFVNKRPQANDDTATVRYWPLNQPRYTPVTIEVAANDADSDGSISLGAGSITIVNVPNKGGTVDVKSAKGGTVRYTPLQGFRGSETFTYTIKDDLGADSTVATVRINVTR